MSTIQILILKILCVKHDAYSIYDFEPTLTVMIFLNFALLIMDAFD